MQEAVHERDPGDEPLKPAPTFRRNYLELEWGAFFHVPVLVRSKRQPDLDSLLKASMEQSASIAPDTSLAAVSGYLLLIA